MIAESRIETTKGMCVVALTKHIMNKLALPEDAAFTRLLRMKLYELLMDSDTRLFFEPNTYLCKACDYELDDSEERMYEFINE